jgi:eukaryotic-like serine/threonine-protein kinase
MSEHPQRFFEFDNYLLDSQQRLLFRNGEALDLTPKVFDILLELVESGGRLVEKKELMESVWPDSFVEESNLTQHISTLRKKLGHDASQQRFILTVPGRGYRFVTPVKSWDDDAVVTVQERIRSRVTVKDAEGFDEPTALEEISASPRLLTPRTASPVRRHHVLIILAGLILLGAVGAVLVRSLRRPASPSFANVKLTRFTTNGKIDCAAISPNGREVAYVIVDRGESSLWIRQTATANTGVLVISSANENYIGLTFSPDNDYIYYVAAPLNSPTTLYRIPALGGKPTRLADDVDTTPTFSPDGKRMAYMRGYPDQQETALLLAGSDGSAETKLASLKGPGSQINQPGPSWSPDGDTIACSVTLSDDFGQHQEIYLAGVRTGAFKPLTNNKWFKVLRVAWTNDGKGLLTTAADPDATISQVWYVAYPSGEARRVTNDLSDYRGLTLSGDSQFLAVVQSDQQTNVWVEPAGDRPTASQITSTNYDGFDGLSWTPDGRLLYSAVRNGSSDVWITDFVGKQKNQLTQDAGRNASPVMSPDGGTIVFISTRDGKQHLWKMDADGSHPQRLTSGERDTHPVFSPDGQWIIYRSANFGPATISKVSILGGSPVPVIVKGLSGPPAISPDGKLLAFTYRQLALSEGRLAVVPLDGSGPIKILEAKVAPRRLLVRWTNDGSALAYIKTLGGISNIWSQPLEGASKQLTNFDTEQIYNFAFSSDGRLAVTRGHESSDVVLIQSTN